LKSPTIVFTAPLRLAIEEREVREPAPTEFLARARVSAISTGTEMTLFFCMEFAFKLMLLALEIRIVLSVLFP